MTIHPETENCALRQQLEALLQEARCNEEKMRRFDLLERRLISAATLRELVRLLLLEYKQAFCVEVVTLTLLDSENEASRILADELDANAGVNLSLIQSPALLNDTYGQNLRPWLGRFQYSSHQALFGASTEPIASVALLPLTRKNELIGSLHFGSSNPERYTADCGTAFLERLSAIIGVCLDSAFNQERLKLVGLTDGLTGVQNRRYFEHRCEVEISQARRYQHPLACMFLDIDKFKRINDTHGHQSGDEVLRAVANAIQTQLRAGDTIARYGGEEFVVLLPQTADNYAQEIAERIRTGIASRHFQAHSGQQINVTISIGLAMLPAHCAAETIQSLASQLVATADKALYQAKHTGRNRVVCDESVGSKGNTDSARVNAWRSWNMVHTPFFGKAIAFLQGYSKRLITEGGCVIRTERDRFKR
jgi:diguanylate cyclase (GGDEF)-like protein